MGVLDKLREADVWPRMQVSDRDAAAPQPLAGLTFVVTGTLPGLTRQEAKQFIQSYGGKVAGSVSKKTDFLVAGEKAGSKLIKAQELDVKVIGEQELRSFVRTS